MPQPSLTSRDEEPYILTPDEETEAIDYAKTNYLRRKIVRMKQLGLLQDQIDIKVAEINWGEVFNVNVVKSLLAIVNSNKIQKEWHDEQARLRREAEIQKKKDIIARCDAKYFYNLMKRSCLMCGKEMIETDDTLKYMKVLCWFFCNDPRFETELGFDFSKGLWIRGNAGVGKTFPLECIRDNHLSPFNIHSMIEIASQVKDNGEYTIADSMIVIDDVGSEQPVVNHYGTKINWFKEFIELYYAVKKDFNRLIVTTNCSFKEIEDKYGFRVRSRVKDMFNIIDVTGDDLRGK